MKKSSDTTGNQTRDLPACSAVTLKLVHVRNREVHYLGLHQIVVYKTNLIIFMSLKLYILCKVYKNVEVYWQYAVLNGLVH